MFHLSQRKHPAFTSSLTLRFFLYAALFTVPLLPGLPARVAAAIPNRELVTITSPQREIDYGSSQVNVQFTLSNLADKKKLTVVLNGREITQRLHGAVNPSGDTRYAFHLHSSDGLRAGRNTLIVQAFDQSGKQSFVKRPFYIAAPVIGGGLSATATALPSAVSISSSVVNQTDSFSLASYAISVNGQSYYPGMSSSESCPSGTTVLAGMQVLVLNRQTLEKIGYECFDTSNAASQGQFQSFLSSLGNGGSLVIASSFFGASSGSTGVPFDTTAIGGTLYTCTSGTCNTPLFYSVIGVPGLKAGQAYETSVTDTQMSDGYFPTLAGVLVKDQYENYSFVPNNGGAFVRFKVIPGDAAPSPASVQIGNASNPATITPPTIPATWAGGYWLLLLHRYDLSYIISSTLYETYASTGNQDSLAAALQGAPADNLIILTSIPSQTKSAPTVPTPNLKAAIDALGGAGYGIESAGAIGVAYTLISTTDKNVPRNQAIVSSEKYLAQGESGAVSGVLARDHSNLFFPITYVENKTRDADDTTDTTQYDLYNTPAQPSTPWPVPSTDGQAAAYAALSKQITAEFGCSNASPCSDYRSYYADQNTTANFCSTDPSNFSAGSNPIGFTQADYTVVQTQLHSEKIYVCNVIDLLTNVSNVFTQEELNVPLLLDGASTEVGKVTSPTSPPVGVNQLRLVNLELSLVKLVPIPGVSQAIGMIQSIFHFATRHVNSASVNVVPTELVNLTVDQLQSGSVSQYFTLQLATETAFQTILDDWGKLSVVGANIGNQVPAYEWTPTTTSAMLPAFNLSTRTEFYNILLPIVYSVDGWYRLSASDPKDLGYWNYAGGLGPVFYGCNGTYTARPDNSFVAYQNLGNSSLSDTFVLTTTLHGANPDFPASDLVSVLLGKPNQDGTGGLNLVPDLLFSTNSLLPSRYAINTLGEGTGNQPNQNCGCVVGSKESTNPCGSNF